MGFLGLRGVGSAAVSVALLAGCAAAAPAVGPVMSTVIPVGGVPLSHYGLSHGPAGFSLPAGLPVSSSIDQPNVVTLLISGTGPGTDVPGYLRPLLPGLGYRITGDAHNAMTFASADWEGAWTCSDVLCGFTLRNLKAAPVKRGG